MHRMLLVSAVACLAASAAMAQDPVKVDPQHHTVVFENEQVRVLRVHYGPNEKSAMHSHPNAVVIFLSDADRKSTTPDGKSVERHGKAGETKWAPAETHMPENISDKPLDGILVELKCQPAEAQPAAKSGAK